MIKMSDGPVELSDEALETINELREKIETINDLQDRIEVLERDLETRKKRSPSPYDLTQGKKGFPALHDLDRRQNG
jgi:hypothetical protein